MLPFHVTTDEICQQISSAPALKVVETLRVFEIDSPGASPDFLDQFLSKNSSLEMH